MTFKTNPGKELYFLSRNILKDLGELSSWLKLFFFLTKWLLYHTCPLGRFCAYKHRHSKNDEELIRGSGCLWIQDKLWSGHSRCWLFLTLVFIFPLPQKMKFILSILYFCLANSISKCLVVTSVIWFFNLSWNCYPKRLGSADVNMGK